MSKLFDSDEIMDDPIMPASQPQLHTRVDEASLNRAFEKQQQRLEDFVKVELDKRLPLAPEMGTASSLSKQASSLFGLLSSSDSRSKPKDAQTIVTLLEKNNQLQRQINGLRSSLGKLEKVNASLEAANRVSTADYDKTRRELAQEKVKNAELERKTSNLRSMLIPEIETQLSDSEVVAKFISLRSQILKLVKTAWSHDLLEEKMEVSDEQKRIFGPFYHDGVSKKYLDNRLRGVVFSILHDQIFSVRHHALPLHKDSLGDTLCRTESFMCQKLPKDSHASIIDWRLATMKATAYFRDEESSLVSAAYNEIDRFFGVLQRRSDKAVEGTQLLGKICKDAVDLSLMMRSAKDEYRVNVLPGAIGQPIEEWELAEDEVDYPALKESERPGTIAYIMTGALVKVPYRNAENLKVLEKAEAAVYSRPNK